MMKPTSVNGDDRPLIDGLSCQNSPAWGHYFLTNLVEMQLILVNGRNPQRNAAFSPNLRLIGVYRSLNH
jgi:hypothetical protein